MFILNIFHNFWIIFQKLILFLHFAQNIAELRIFLLAGYDAGESQKRNSELCSAHGKGFDYRSLSKFIIDEFRLAGVTAGEQKYAQPIYIFQRSWKTVKI